MKKTILGVLLLMLCANIKAQNDEVNTRFKVKENTNSIELGQWDGSRNRIESVGRKLFLTSYTGGISFGNSGAEQIAMNNLGYFGIGTITPSEKLEIKNGGLKLSTNDATGNYELKIKANHDYNNKFVMSSGNTVVFQEKVIPDVGGTQNSKSFISNYYGIGFATATVNPSAKEHVNMYISGASDPNGSGYVGIGTTTPDKQLTVKNEIKILKSGNTRTKGDKAEIIFGEAKSDFYSGSIRIENTNSNPGYVNPKMVFSLQDYNTNALEDVKERMTISSKGNVGIGTSNPEYIMDIVSNADDYKQLRVKSPGSPLIKLSGSYNSGNGAEFWQNGKGDVLLNINSVTNGFYIQSDGKIGMGTISPDSKLTINNNSADATNGVFSLTNMSGSVNDVVSMRFNAGGGTSGTFLKHMRQGSSGADFGIFTAPTLTGASVERLRVTKDGNVGIGTTTTGIHKLAVEGSIGAREIKVQATGWYDFVFEKDYNLPTIEEVEKHIKEKGHLKDIPSAKEVLENGIHLGEMNGKLLQKIEELTLYTIQQEKKINEQEKKMNMQEEKIKKQEEQLKSLKDLSDRLSKLEKLLKSK